MGSNFFFSLFGQNLVCVFSDSWNVSVEAETEVGFWKDFHHGSHCPNLPNWLTNFFMLVRHDAAKMSSCTSPVAREEDIFPLVLRLEFMLRETLLVNFLKNVSVISRVLTNTRSKKILFRNSFFFFSLQGKSAKCWS